MKYKKLRLVLLLLIALSIGGCSLFTNQSAQRREMLEIAESQKMKVAIENMLKEIDHKAFTSEGVIHSYTILENELEYNPMGGMNVYLMINEDKQLAIDTTVQMEDSGEFNVGSYGISAELSRLLREVEEDGQ